MPSPPPRSTARRRSVMLAWTAALFVPAAVLTAWIFQSVNPFAYLGILYSPEMPFLLRLPGIGLAVGALLAWMAARRDQCASPSSQIPSWLIPLLVLGGSAAGATAGGLGFVLNLLRASAGIAVLVAAVSLGLRVLSLRPLTISRDRFASSLETLVVAAAVGLGLFALLLFMLGSLGLISPWAWWPIIAVAGITGFKELLALAKSLSESAKRFVRERDAIALTAAIGLIVFLALHLPLLWTPPLEYDVLEYHLGSIAQYHRDGRISFLENNIYATFPQVGEMLFMLGTILAGGTETGLPAAHLLLFAAWVLTIAAVAALAHRLMSVDEPNAPAAPPAAAPPILAALLYALIPMGAQWAAEFYVEHIQALFHIVALGAGAAYLQDRAAGVRDKLGWLILAGLLAGLCCGAKYTGLLFTLLPITASIAVIVLATRGTVIEALIAGATIAFTGTLALAPWLLRNGLATGDPFHPLGLAFLRRFQSPTDGPDGIDHFEVAIRPGARSLSALKNAVMDLAAPLLPSRPFFSSMECGPHLLPFALPGFAALRRPAHWFLASVIVLDFALWLLMTYRLHRFLFPLMAPLAVIAALGIARMWEWSSLRKWIAFLAATAVIALAPLSMLFVHERASADAALGRASAEQAAHEQAERTGSDGPFEGWRAINALPPGSKVLLIGEAQTFYLRESPSYAVVFNTSELQTVLMDATTHYAAREALKAKGITHIYIDYGEWFRLDWSYGLTLSANGTKWEPATLSPERKESLRRLLEGGHIGAYGALWEGNKYPACLRIDQEAYDSLALLLQQYTRVEWSFKRGDAPKKELRRLE